MPVLAWWLSPALPTVLNHIPSLLSQSQLSHSRPGRPLGSSSDLAQSGWAAVAGADFTAGFTREGWPRADSPPRKGPGADPVGQRSPWEAVFGFWNPLPDHGPAPAPPPGPPPLFQWGGRLLFHCCHQHRGYSSSREGLRGLGHPWASSWVMFTVLSAPHWGPPEDTP